MDKLLLPVTLLCLVFSVLNPVLVSGIRNYRDSDSDQDNELPDVQSSTDAENVESPIATGEDGNSSTDFEEGQGDNRELGLNLPRRVLIRLLRRFGQEMDDGKVSLILPERVLVRLVRHFGLAAKQTDGSLKVIRPTSGRLAKRHRKINVSLQVPIKLISESSALRDEDVISNSMDSDVTFN